MQKVYKPTIPFNVNALLIRVLFSSIFFIPHKTYTQKGIDFSRENNLSLFKEAYMPERHMIQDTKKDSNVTLIGRWANGPCYAVAADGGIGYFGNGGYLEIVDFSHPTQPVELGKIVLPSVVRGVAVNGNYVYVADGYGWFIYSAK